MMQQGNGSSVRSAFKVRRHRQLTAIVITVFLLVSILWKMQHPGLLFGELSRSTVLLLEILTIGAFLFFTADNWRCPACSRHLGPGINPQGCRKCGVRLR